MHLNINQQQDRLYIDQEMEFLRDRITKLEVLAFVTYLIVGWTLFVAPHIGTWG